MSDHPSSRSPAPAPAGSPLPSSGPIPAAAATAASPLESVTASRRWWIKLFLQPALFLVCGAILLFGLGLAQRFGWISAGGAGSGAGVTAAGNTRYICPMMCTPPQAQPGRCPVCAMELVPATSGVGKTDPRAVQIDPATRRIANIQTAAVASRPILHTIHAIGELRYDEGSMKTIAAYVDGRLDQLYADYTGIVVQKGDPLALLYSPRLYSGQLELLLARKGSERGESATLAGLAQANADMYRSAKERLILLGMTDAQIERLEEAGEASSRLQVLAPISGTVTEKLAVEGQYVQEGDAIYKLADLSTVWLVLRLFPEDAAAIRYGQKVVAEMQSLPGRAFAGRVAFIDPSVDPATRTVGVRVVVPNADGALRVGDYAKATLEVPWVGSQPSPIYDPELAHKWISPRHPHVIADEPGECPICGEKLVPAARFGFTDEPSASPHALLVPRDAVLMAGNNSVVYVETDPGRFEIRRVALGPTVGDQRVIHRGVKLGEQVATRGNFLIDSQMQLAGNPSLIDPTRLEASGDRVESPAIAAALAPLSPEDRELVVRQGICPVGEQQLGSMGTPPKIQLDGKTIFICCEHCRETLLKDPAKYWAKLEMLSQQRVPAQGTDASPQPPPSATTLPPEAPPATTPPATTPPANREGDR